VLLGRDQECHFDVIPFKGWKLLRALSTKKTRRPVISFLLQNTCTLAKTSQRPTTPYPGLMYERGHSRFLLQAGNLSAINVQGTPCVPVAFAQTSGNRSSASSFVYSGSAKIFEWHEHGLSVELPKKQPYHQFNTGVSNSFQFQGHFRHI